MRVTHWLLALSCLLISATSSAGIKNHLQRLIESKETQHLTTPIEEQKEQYGLAFIFSSTCEYCILFAPAAEAFSAEYNLPIYPFSVDGQGLHTFQHPLIATNDILLEFFKVPENVVYPALFLVNLDNRKHIPLAIGNVPYNVLVETYTATRQYPHLQARLQ